MSAPPLLELDAVTKRFGGLKAVGGDEGLSLAVPDGAFLGLIGPNGAGKSTTFNLITGVLAPDTGEVRYAGAPLPVAKPAAVAAAGIGRTFQKPRAFPSLTVLQNVAVGPESRGERLWPAFTGAWRESEAQVRERAEAALAEVGLAARKDERVGSLSGGELRLLEVARQLVRRPRLLLLDEPTAGVAPDLQQRLGALLAKIHRTGVTLVVVEHNLHFLMSVADRIAVLVGGERLADGTPQEIRADERVIAAYLGADHAA